MQKIYFARVACLENKNKHNRLVYFNNYNFRNDSLIQKKLLEISFDFFNCTLNIKVTCVRNILNTFFIYLK